MNDTTPTAEELRIRSQHKQEVARIEHEHEQEVARIEHEHERQMALLDADALRRMPLPLRLIFDDRLRAKVEQAATDMSEAGGFTPKHLMGKLAACKVVIVKSIGWNLDPYSVANATYELPNGRVGFEGVLYRAIAESSGLIVGEFEYEWYGDWQKLPRPSFKMVRNDNGKFVPKEAWEYWGPLEEGLGITVSATIAATGQKRSLNFDLVDAYPRNATTWPTRPKLQIINPATRAFVTLVKPALLMGVHFRDAPEDAPAMRDVTPAATAQPLAAPMLFEACSADGEVFRLQPGEIRQWVQSQVSGASGDQLDALVEANAAVPEISAAIEAAIRSVPRLAPAAPQQATPPAPAAEADPAPASPGEAPSTDERPPVTVLGTEYLRHGSALNAIEKALDPDKGLSEEKLLAEEPSFRKALGIIWTHANEKQRREIERVSKLLDEAMAEIAEAEKEQNEREMAEAERLAKIREEKEAAAAPNPLVANTGVMPPGSAAPWMVLGRQCSDSLAVYTVVASHLSEIDNLGDLAEFDERMKPVLLGGCSPIHHKAVKGMIDQLRANLMG